MPTTPSNLRGVTIKAMTDAGWVAGTIFVPASVQLVDYMERAPGFLSMRDVFMQAHSKRVPFLALQRHAIVFMGIEGDEDPASAEDTQIMEDHSVSCLVTGGMLRGTVVVKPGLRLSDYLAKHPQYVTLRNCKYKVRGPGQGAAAEETSAFVLVNPERVIGVSERSEVDGT